MVEFKKERRAMHEGLLFWPAPELGVLVVKGADRRTWLNAMATCDLSKLGPDGGAYGLCTGKNGKILGEFWLAQDAERLFLATHKSRLAFLLEHFDRHIMMEDAELSDGSDTLSAALLLGPGCASALKHAKSLSYVKAGADLRFSELGGGLLVMEAGRGLDLQSELAQALGDGFALAGAEAFEALRIEEGIPRFGIDFDEQNYPQEASLERYAVSFQKGCYLGQEAVFMLEARGHAKKRLVKLWLEGEAVPARGTPLFIEQEGGAREEVGTITSAVAMESGAAALAYVKYKHARTGVLLWAEGREARIRYAPPMKE